MTVPITLYQFELCPFCHKVKAALDLKSLAYQIVEVNPINKKELPTLPAHAPRKVPVIEVKGERIFDSTTIINYLDEQFTSGLKLTPTNPELRTKSDAIEQWVDDDLAQVLPTVIYGHWSDAIRAAKVVARTSNFGWVQNALVRGGGSIIMHQVAKRIAKKRGGHSPEAMLRTEIDKLENWIGEGPFVCGAQISTGDVAAQGCLTCVREFPAFQTIMQRPRIAAWYHNVQAARDKNKPAQS